MVGEKHKHANTRTKRHNNLLSSHAHVIHIKKKACENKPYQPHRKKEQTKTSHAHTHNNMEQKRKKKSGAYLCHAVKVYVRREEKMREICCGFFNSSYDPLIVSSGYHEARAY
jgi:hypothetical protein